MTAHAWVLEVRPGCEEEYKARHDAIWPEMLEALGRAGFRNYTIFRHGLTLFGVFECDDLGELQRRIAQEPVNARWSESMAPLMRVEVDPRTGFPYLLPQQFHMD